MNLRIIRDDPKLTRFMVRINEVIPVYVELNCIYNTFKKTRLIDFSEASTRRRNRSCSARIEYRSGTRYSIHPCITLHGHSCRNGIRMHRGNSYNFAALYLSDRILAVPGIPLFPKVTKALTKAPHLGTE